jgi:hypothetical protein
MNAQRDKGQSKLIQTKGQEKLIQMYKKIYSHSRQTIQPLDTQTMSQCRFASRLIVAHIDTIVKIPVIKKSYDIQLSRDELRKDHFCIEALVLCASKYIHDFIRTGSDDRLEQVQNLLDILSKHQDFLDHSHELYTVTFENTDNDGLYVETLQANEGIYKNIAETIMFSYNLINLLLNKSIQIRQKMKELITT